MISVQKKIRGNKVLGAWTFDNEKSKGMSIGIKNSGENQAESICSLKDNLDGTCSLIVYEDKMEEINASVCIENYDETKVLMQTYLVFVKPEYVRDVQVFNGSEIKNDTDDENTGSCSESEDSWVDANKVSIYVGTYSAVSEQWAKVMASEDRGYDTEILYTEVR